MTRSTREFVMPIPSRAWRIAAGVFGLANVPFAGIAYARGETVHGTVHAALAVLFGWLATRQRGAVTALLLLPAAARLAA